MITGWLVKLVLSIVVIGFLAVELGTPLIVRVQLDGTAHDAADRAGSTMYDGGSEEAAAAAASEEAASDDAEVIDFSVNDQGRPRVKVRKQANSYLFDKWDPMKGWYEVEASATGAQGRR